MQTMRFSNIFLKSLELRSGRSVTVLPHGVLFRDAEKEMRQNMIKQDLVEAVIGLGEKLFFGATMECCLVICRKSKPINRKGKVLFIDAKKEIRFEQSNAYLEDLHIDKITSTYKNYENIEGFCSIVENDNILLNNDGSLNVKLYVKNDKSKDDKTVIDWIDRSIENQKLLNDNFSNLLLSLNKIGTNDN